MKRHLRWLLGTWLVAVVAVGAAGQTLTPEERAQGVRHLNATRLALLDATNGLSEAQWKFKPAADRWSVAEIVEHLAVSEDLLFQRVTEQVMKSEPLAEPRAEAPEGDAAVGRFLNDRSRKFQAPEPVQPTGQFGSPEKALEHFLASRARTLEYLKTTEGLRAHVGEGPGGQKLDAYQWLLFISGHTERHTKQLYEVKADPNFPKD